MSKRKWMISVGAFLLVLLMATGYLAIAAEYGSKEDPLVALSYITDVLSPEAMKTVEENINKKASELEKTLDEKLASSSSSLDQKISDFEKRYADAVDDEAFAAQVAEIVLQKMQGDAAASAPAESWQVIKVESGKTMMLPLGAEVVLRIGSGSCYSTGSVGLINLSNGETLANGGALAANNLYLVTIEGCRGVKATSEMTVLVKGSYTIE